MLDAQRGQDDNAGKDKLFRTKSPLAILMIVLMLGLEVLAGRPVGAYVWMMFASVGLPLIPAFGMGALAGPQILRLPSGKRGHAAGWGAAAGLGALLLWLLLLEHLAQLSVGKMQTTGGGGNVPGAAVVVGYLVVLPLIVVLSLLVGATAGVLLHYVSCMQYGKRRNVLSSRGMFS